MKTFKRRVLPILLSLLLIFSVVQQDINANEVLGGYSYPDIDPIYTKGTGGGIVYTDYPGFAVSLTESTFTNPILEEDGAEVRKAKYEDYYKNRFPCQKQAVYFIPSEAYNNTFPISWYNASTGKIVTPKNVNLATGKTATAGDKNSYNYFKIREIVESVNDPDNLNYTALHNKILNVSDQSGLYKKLGKGEWKKLVSNNEKDNLAIWNFLLRDKASSIDTALKKYLKTSVTLTGKTALEIKLIHAAAWVDLVATLYILSPPGEQKNYYENQIENYLIGDSKTVGIHPSHISIVPVATVRTRNIEPEYRYISAIDYIQYIYGATPAASLDGIKHLADTKINYINDPEGWMKLIDLSVVRSLKDAPKAARVTNLTGAAAESNGFNWGMRAVLGSRLSTTTGGSHNWYSTTVDGLLQRLRFKGGMYGFVIAYPGTQFIPDETLKGRFGITLDGEDKEIVPGAQDTIGEPVQITLELKQSNSREVKTWNKRLSETFTGDYPKIKITMDRETPIARTCGTTTPTIGDDNPELSTSSTYYNGSAATEDAKYKKIEVAELKKFLFKGSTINFTDETQTYKIAPNSSVTFKYKATVSIKLSSTEKVVLFTGDVGEKRKTYSRPDTPPEVVEYTSQPSYWSEIKNGEPGNETFEAMAGTPTTRNLYFASGGSEFVVETKFQYVKDTETTRTYRSHFSAIESEFKANDALKGNNIGYKESSTMVTPAAGGGTLDYNITPNSHDSTTHVWAQWDGSIKNNTSDPGIKGYAAGSAGSTCAGAGYTAGNVGQMGAMVNNWDMSDYNAAVAAAYKWAADNNGKVYIKTSASEEKERKWLSTTSDPTGCTYGQDAVPAAPGAGYTYNAGTPSSSVSPSGCAHTCSTEWDVAPKDNTAPPGEPSNAVSGQKHSHNHNCGSFTEAKTSTTSKVPDKTFSIRVEGGTMPRHQICGPSCSYTLPAVQDTWTQKIKYDHMKVNVARVWKLDKSAINGMIDITGTDEFKASVVSGDPTIFFNQADPDPNNPNDKDGNDSAHGRLRYSLETNQHDAVVWDEGTRTNKDDGRGSNGVSTGIGHANTLTKGIIYTNDTYSNVSGYHVANSDAIDKDTFEYARFNLRRTSKNTATVISDFLILQTSSGDQSILYFDRKSGEKDSQDNFEKVAATKEEIWDNNQYSFAKNTPNDINIGSYNGKYYTPLSKYSSYATKNVPTIFDGTLAAGLNRTPRPSVAMRLVNKDIDIIDTIPNSYYETGTSSVFYRNILNIGGTEPSLYPESAYNYNYYDTGMEYESAYSDSHSKVNDIVIHNPVSTEFSMVMPLASSRDQRTTASKALGGNIQDPTVETIHRLNTDHPKQNLIYNGSADIFNSDGSLTNWKTWASNPNDTTFTKRTTSDWWISSPSTFEIITTAGQNYAGVYYTDVVGIGGDSYTFTGKMGAHRVQGYFYIEAFNANGVSLGTFSTITVNNTGVVQNLSFDFTAPVGTTKLRVHIVNGNTVGYTGVSEHVFADDLVLIDNTTTSWQTISYETEETTEINNPNYVAEHTIANPNYVAEHSIENPNYVPATEGGTTPFDYLGRYQTFTAPATGTYTLEVWGAQGGGSSGGYGGYAKGNVYLARNQEIYVYVGGNDGWNGGGAGGLGANPGGNGGGASDIRTAGTELTNRIIVAGGGGGSGGSSNGGSNGNGSAYAGGSGGAANDGSGGRDSNTCSGYGGSGATSSSPGTGGSAGEYNSSSSSDGTYYQAGGGGGGGGYYGGGGGGSGSIYGSSNNYQGQNGNTGTLGQGGYGGNCTFTYGVSAFYSWPGGGGGAGAGYLGGVTNGTLISNARSGNGYAVITTPATAAIGTPTLVVPAVGTPTIVVPAIGTPTIVVPAVGTPKMKSVFKITTTIDQAPEDWYEDVIVTTPATNPVSVIAGTFMGLDYKDPDIWEDKYKAPGASRTWDASKSAWKVTGNLYMYLKKEYAPTIDSNKSYSMEVTVLVENNDNKYFYWGGERLDSSKNHLEGVGGTFDYSATNGATHPQEGVWTTYRLDVKQGSAADYSGWGNDGCKYFSVGGLLNYQSSGTSTTQTTYIKDIKFYTEETYTPGNFINLDYGFQVYFPNRGDFYGDGSYGISSLSSMRGKGFVDGMDTTEWTKDKIVSLQFNAIYNGNLYLAGEDIPLDVDDIDGVYDLYCPLANSEAISSEVTFKVIANNGDCVDNEYMANKERGSYLDAKHSGIKVANIDVVGRIGNLMMEDTGDFRFANLFKKEKSPLSWIVPQLIKDVDLSQQNNILGSRVDIRGESVSADNNWLNTYGMLNFADKSPISFPLTPDKNNIKALQRQPLRVGYNSLMDVQTIGNYSSGSVQIIPYYYQLDLKTGTVTPVDIYMIVNGKYTPINLFGNENATSVYNNVTQLNWDDEYARRNYGSEERATTEDVLHENKIFDSDGNIIDLIGPIGRNYSYGNNQLLQLTPRNRTFIGSSNIYGQDDSNPGDRLSDMDFKIQAQRWHFTVGLPSSAVAVKKGMTVTKSNLDSIESKTSVLLMALDIQSVGSTYALKYSGSNENRNVVIAGKTFNLSSIANPVVAVMSSNKSSADDLDIRGTH